MPVEFIDPDPDETARRDPEPPRQRWTVLIRVAVAALLVAAVAAWALTRSDPAPPRHRPTAVVHDRSTPSRSPSPLPVVTTCRTDARPADLAGALRRYLHRVVVDRAGGTRCSRAGRTVYESVTGHARGVTITVEAAVRGIGGVNYMDPHFGARPGDVLLGRIEALTAGLHVQVFAFGRPHTVPPYDALRRVADFVSLNVVL